MGVLLKEAQLFLASHLNELNHIDDKHEAATVALATIAAVEPQINETYMELYLSQVTLEDNILQAALSYFRGAQILDVLCDCGQEESCSIENWHSNFWFQRGNEDRFMGARQYSQTVAWIESLRTKLN